MPCSVSRCALNRGSAPYPKSFPLRLKIREPQIENLFRGEICAVNRSDAFRTNWSITLRMYVPSGSVISTGTFATISSCDVCRNAVKNQSRSVFTGPPSAPLKFCTCAVPLALVNPRAFSSSSTLSDCHVPLVPPMNTAPLTTLPPSLRMLLIRMPPDEVSAGIAAVITLVSATSASS